MSARHLEQRIDELGEIGLVELAVEIVADVILKRRHNVLREPGRHARRATAN